MEESISKLAEYGVIGIFALVFIYLFIQKDKQLTESQAKRVEDVKETIAKYTELVSRVDATMSNLIEIVKAKLG